MPDEPTRSIVLPKTWYLGAHGDPVAQFTDDSPVLLLLPGGEVRWRSIEDAITESEAGDDG